jgi:hypothetical protein
MAKVNNLTNSQLLVVPNRPQADLSPQQMGPETASNTLQRHPKAAL